MIIKALSVFSGFFLLLTFFSSGHGVADKKVPVIYLNGQHSAKDPRVFFKERALRKILEVTEKEYGPLELRVLDRKLERTRQLKELIKGTIVQVGIEPTKTAWEENLLPVYIPLYKGLLGWRICLINEDSQKEISKVKTLEDLKKIPAGTGSQWSSTKALKKAGFYVVTGTTYESLFKMLQAGRFTMFHRGLTEIFDELEARKAEFPRLAVDKHIAVVMPLPLYIFVTPRMPSLKKRIEEGLKMLVANGWLDKSIDELFGEDIRRADLKNRLIFRIDNPNVSKKTTPFHIKKYWYEP